MGIQKQARATCLTCLLMLDGGCADVSEAGDLPQEEDEQIDSTPKALTIDNGLTTINGLTSRNGLMSINGLTTRNGLRVTNGLVSINGLATTNGLSVVNGRSVNCAGATRCTGAPDGLLSAATGLMKDEEGVNLASYVTRCALPPDRTIVTTRWDGQRVSLTGELGLAPEWESGQCPSACQEKVSACLMALVNGSGQHVAITISATWARGALRQAPDPSLLKEAVFFGNVFTDPPEAYVAIHRDWARSLKGLSGDDVIPVPRMCSGIPGIEPADYFSQYDLCPIKIIGEAGHVIWDQIPGAFEKDNYDLCYMTNNSRQAKFCYLSWTEGERNFWYYPLTTFVSREVW